MGRYIFSKKAIEDISNIWNYTVETWSEAQADTYYYYLLIKGAKYLAENPRTGKRYDEILDGLRGYKVKRHILFYVVLAEGDVEIVRILHEGMDISKHLN